MDGGTKVASLACLFGMSALGAMASAQEGAGARAAPACIARPAVRRMQIVDAETVLFFMRDKTAFKNSLTRQCPGLRRDSQLSFTAADRQVCSGTNFQVMLRVGSGSNSESVLLPGGSTMSVPRPDMIGGPVCALGEFSAISTADATALVESARANRREQRRRSDESDSSEPR